MIDILISLAITLIWTLLSVFIQNKFWVFWHSYVHKCKQGERHTFVYTSARIDITQHSWAGRGFWTTFLAKTEKTELTNESSRLHTEKTEWGLPSLQEVDSDEFDFTEKDEDLSISPKASLPPWQIGVSFKSQSPFLFLKNTMYMNKKQTIKVK